MRSSMAIRDVTLQQQKHSAKQKTKEPWNGQWERPHGDDTNDYFDNAEDERGGLGITSALNSSAPAGTSERAPTRSFRTASSVLSKYEKIEVST